MTDATQNALQLLIAERDRINQAIAILQGGAVAPSAAPAAAAPAAAAPAPRRRGRPKGSKNVQKVAAKRGRKEMSPEAREAVSKRMAAYWAARRKEKAKAAKK